MNKTIKKTLSTLLSASMIAASVVLPTAASADVTPLVAGDTVIKEWKFDFGAANTAPEEGFTLVTPDMNFVSNTSGEDQYGFLGIGEEDYKVTDRYDGWSTQKGQKIELSAGTGTAGGIGVTGAGGTDDNEGKDIYGNKADIYYPTRFALKVTDDTYYRVKATVTTLDPSKPAKASLYTERKHPLYTEKTIAADTTETTTFSVRVTPIYYEKSNPTGAIKDEMLTVGVLGENTALASVEIQQVETIPTLWVLGDSTVTDGNTTLPFFPLQNYTGVGTGLTKYLPRNIAMVNEGEGGLNAADNNHFNMVASRIKAGDYMYVEYGHNHKDDGPTGYKACLDKYYNACHAKGAKLLIVSPVQSVSSWNETTKRWNDRFGGETNFEGAGKSYVAEKVTAGADDIAFVNLTKTSVEFVDKVTVDNGEAKTAAQFYYQTPKGGSANESHPNDQGAENFAYCAFTAMKEITDATQKAVVQPLIDGMTDEQPNLVSSAVMAGGLGGDAWPAYTVKSAQKYPCEIDDIVFDSTGNITSATVTTRAAEIPMNNYGIVIVTVYGEEGTEKGTFSAVDQVDNTSGYGPQTITNFKKSANDLVLAEGDTYSAIVLEATGYGEGGLTPVEDGAVYSAVYKPTDVVEQLLLNEEGDSFENFEYYGATYDGKTSDYIGFNNNGWSWIGSASRTSYLNEAGGTKYVTITSDGGGSFYPVKTLAKQIGTTGRYMFSADLQYLSGSGLTFKLVAGHDDKHRGGTEGLTLFTVGSGGKIESNGKEIGTISSEGFTNVTYILDIDLGTATVSVGGNEVGAAAPTVIPLTNYQTTALTVKPSKMTQILLGEDRKAFSVSVANLQVAKLKDKTLPEYTATVAANDAAKGTVSISGADDTGVAIGYDNGTATVKADEAMTVYLIEAKYTGNVLTEVIPTKMEFTAAGTKTQSVTAGSKLMVWKTLDGVEPVVDAITATGTIALPADNEVTDAINTVTTVTATPAQGSVFMGWYDNSELTGDPVSMDNPYTFRLREDITLTAKFVKEPSVSDVTNYSLAPEKANVKAVSGATFNVNIADAVDNLNTPISVVKNSDATWESQTAGVTVANGVVTIGDGFEITAGETKPITIKATLNNIEKTCTVTAHLYDYYENFDGGDLTKINWFTNAGDGSATLVSNTLQIKGSSAKNNTYSGTHFAAPADITDKLVTIKFDYKTSSVGAGNSTSHLFLSDTTSNTPTWDVSGANFKTGSEGIGLAANTQYAVTITINNKTKTATVSAQPAEGTALTYNIDNTNVAVSTLFFRPGKGITDTIDNLSVVIADAPTE